VLLGLGFVEIISLPQTSLLRRVFLGNHLASTDNLITATKRQNTYRHKLIEHKKRPNKQQKTQSMKKRSKETQTLCAGCSKA